MPKYYCDYCDVFLTHDSPSVRKTHNGGRKHKENVRFFYQTWMEEQAQKLIDATTRAFTSSRLLAPGVVPPTAAALRPPGALPIPMLPIPMAGALPLRAPLPTGMPTAGVGFFAGPGILPSPGIVMPSAGLTPNAASAGMPMPVPIPTTVAVASPTGSSSYSAFGGEQTALKINIKVE